MAPSLGHDVSVAVARERPGGQTSDGRRSIDRPKRRGGGAVARAAARLGRSRNGKKRNVATECSMATRPAHIMSIQTAYAGRPTRPEWPRDGAKVLQASTHDRFGPSFIPAAPGNLLYAQLVPAAERTRLSMQVGSKYSFTLVSAVALLTPTASHTCPSTLPG